MIDNNVYGNGQSYFTPVMVMPNGQIIYSTPLARPQAYFDTAPKEPCRAPAARWAGLAVPLAAPFVAASLFITRFAAF